MTKTWQDQTVTVVRDAHIGDPGFDSNYGQAQSLIELEDGSQKTVPASDVKDAPAKPVHTPPPSRGHK